LVVFAWHHSVVSAIADEFKAVSITGSTKLEDRQSYVEKFQNDPECRLIVCNIQAGGVGITLTAASNVAFIELGWTPAVHDQAEDRVHRIGQTDSVTAWYLLASNTIDEEIARLLDEKRNVVTAATDGGDAQEIHMVNEIVKRII
jgi:SNF2 family DNA or RNA helicase